MTTNKKPKRKIHGYRTGKDGWRGEATVRLPQSNQEATAVSTLHFLNFTPEQYE